MTPLLPKRTNAFLVVFISFSALNVHGQSIEGTYKSYWASTKWSFEFFKDFTYKRTSFGHYGNTVVKGKYSIKGDTLMILSGQQNTHGTVNDKYLIDGDSCIIDIDNKHDYCKNRPTKIEKDGQIWDYWTESPMRHIMYPQLPSSDPEKIREVEYLLQQSLDSKEMTSVFEKDTNLKHRPLIIQSYFEVKANSGIHLNKFGKQVVFKSEEEIANENIQAYIKIEKLNIASDYVTILLSYENFVSRSIISFKRDPIDNKWKVK